MFDINFILVLTLKVIVVLCYLGCDVKCPICGTNMRYDPKHDEYYCPKCGYVTEANTPYPSRPSEDEIGFYTGTSYQSVDLNLGGSISMSELNQIIKGRAVWTRSKKYILSSFETKTFRDNMNFINMILNSLKNEKGYTITSTFKEEYSAMVSKIVLRFEHEQLLRKAEDRTVKMYELFGEAENEEEDEDEVQEKRKKRKRRNYNTFYVFLAVLFHLLQNNYLDKHKNELLDDLWDASQLYVNTSNKSRFFKQLLSKYNMLMPYLKDYNKTVYDKLIAVAYRFNVNEKIVDELFNYLFNKYNLSNYSIDNLVFATVFTVGEVFENKDFSKLKKNIYTVSIQKIVNQMKVLIKREGLSVSDGHLCFTTMRKKVRGRKRKKKTDENKTIDINELLNTPLKKAVFM